MSAFGKKEQNKTSQKNGELVIKGRAVSRGIGIGKVLSLYGQKRQFYRMRLDKSKIEREVRRFRAAIRLAKRQLNNIKKLNESRINEPQIGIFETHLLILEDNSFLSKIEDIIASQRVNAEWAVKLVADSYISEYKAIEDEHLREKYIDLEDVSERILTALGGGRKTSIRLEKDTIIVAKEVKPSTLVELIDSKPKAIITETGGWTSHTFILARELNLPAVTGMKGILRKVNAGEKAIVDGYNGQIILHPSTRTIREYKNDFNKKNRSATETPIGDVVKTLDGQEIRIRANIDLSRDYITAKEFGAKGIGLYRSEFLFNQNKGYPSEKEQVESYRKIGRLVGSDGVKIRTFDLSVEHFADEYLYKEKNPALGLRAVRLSLKNEKQFRIQIRALLRASYENDLDILLPMISDVSEIIQTNKIIEEEKTKLANRRIKFGEPKLGAMVEVPAAILTIEEILSEVDFVNLGTNDLVQYLLAVDRDNETVSDWFRTLHPSILRGIKTVLTAGAKHNKPVIVCGEMAGSPMYAAILVGLGARELSMNMNSIRRVQRIVVNMAAEEARALVQELEDCRTADEIEEKVYENFNRNWSHLFSEHELLMFKKP